MAPTSDSPAVWPGEVVAESKAAVEVARQVPLVYYMILAALILLALLVR